MESKDLLGHLEIVVPGDHQVQVEVMENLASKAQKVPKAMRVQMEPPVIKVPQAKEATKVQQAIQDFLEGKDHLVPKAREDYQEA